MASETKSNPVTPKEDHKEIDFGTETETRPMDEFTLTTLKEDICNTTLSTNSTRIKIGKTADDTPTLYIAARVTTSEHGLPPPDPLALLVEDKEVESSPVDRENRVKTSGPEAECSDGHFGRRESKEL